MDDAKPSPFEPARCLFCNQDRSDFESNLSHMQSAHGLFIPHRQHLIVEPEVLIEYIHLVIFGYNECICCGTQRSSPLAAQQHMLGKGHCRFDMDREDSEFADFWDFSDVDSRSEASDNEDDVNGDEGSHKWKSGNIKGSGGIVRLDEESLRLPSGKLISKNSSDQRTHRRADERKQQAAIDGMSSDATRIESASQSTALIPALGDQSKSLTKSERRAEAFSGQLSRLSESDRQSLVHLPASEQRSILAAQQRQAEKARQVERRYQSRVEGLGNKTLQAHFRPDCPARRNG
ncbi:hypothetical protein KJ359_006729 [Pestalotiopsis sp. 9143b]|nr:hypothetical protein KJ359_006729 [Pestalotiopsis sp. 9143b]